MKESLESKLNRIVARKQAAPYFLAKDVPYNYGFPQYTDPAGSSSRDPRYFCDVCVDGNNAPPCSCLRAFYGGYFWWNDTAHPEVPGVFSYDLNFQPPGPTWSRSDAWPQGCPPVADLMRPAFTAAEWPAMKIAYITRLADRAIQGGVIDGSFQACNNLFIPGASMSGPLCYLVRQCMMERRAGLPCTGPLYENFTEVPANPYIVRWMVEQGCIGATVGSSCTPGPIGEGNICADNQPTGSPGWSSQNCTQRDFANCDPGPSGPGGLAPNFITNENELKMPANEEQKKAAGELIKQLKLFKKKTKNEKFNR